jgi:flagellar hook assembly protein FlgD
MRHYTTIVSGLLVTAALLAQPAPSAAAGATRTEFSIVGETAACPTHTYTVQSGSIIEAFQAVTSASGNSMFTITDAPSHVVITDQQGATYSMRGATWFGGATNDNTGAQVITATHNLEVVAPGLGVVDSIRLIERFRDGVLLSHEFGTCLP